MTVITECISWLIKVTDNNDAQWKPEVTAVLSTRIMQNTQIH
jgi:hypothetical protein